MVEEIKEKVEEVVAEEKKEIKKETKPKVTTKKKVKKESKFDWKRDPWKVIHHPLLTEKSIGMIESQNTLTFITRVKSDKKQIRWAIETALEVKVKKIRTLIDSKGRKKAFVKLTKDFKASDIATRFGML